MEGRACVRGGVAGFEKVLWAVLRGLKSGTVDLGF